MDIDKWKIKHLIKLLDSIHGSHTSMITLNHKKVLNS